MSNSSENAVMSTLKQLIVNLAWGMHAKLIFLFVIIKVVPLVLIAMLAWSESSKMAEELQGRIANLAIELDEALLTTGKVAIDDSMEALEKRVQNEFERTTTDLADRVADLLYSVDGDVRFLASIEPNKEIYENFIQNRVSPVFVHNEWVLAPDKKSWVLAEEHPEPVYYESSNLENEAFSYRPADPFKYENKPLYVEIAYISLDGQELIKVTSDDRVSPELKDVSKKENTFVKAETYFEEVQKLQPGELYVSDVTGAYVGTPILGAYTPAAAEKKGIEFKPEEAAWAGTENPVGKRFEGIIRWATPVEKNGEVVGYISVAFNHDHIIDMMGRIMPTDERYAELGDPILGNYAFIWDHLGKNIVHPRHHSIVGFDPETGDQAIPWIEQSIYDDWQASGQSYADFITTVEPFHEQSRSKKPAKELTAQGLLGLDCRYLNNAPQCVGWFDLTEHGGSGSIHILWTGLTKITTAAAIPYYTGKYENSRVGFGFVAISAGIDEFQAPALATKERLDNLLYEADLELEELSTESEEFILESLVSIATTLTVSTVAMTVIVVVIAIMLASALTNMVTHLVEGFQRFRSGERQFRFYSDRVDELGALADSFDELADTLVESVKEPQVILDSEKNIVYLNEAAEAWYDKNLDDVIGLPFFSINYYAEGSVYCPMTAANKDLTAEIMYNEAKDSFFQDKAVLMSVAEDDEEEFGYIITTFDMTELVRNEQRIEEQRQLLDTIFNESPDMMWLKDCATSKFLMVNPRFSAISGKHTAEYIGKTSVEMHGYATGRESEESDNEVAVKGRTLLREQIVNFVDGHTETLEVLRTPMYNNNGDIVSILGIGRDVTQRVEAQKRLLEIQYDLEFALEEANAANAAKSDFLARMSHEIRTPMNAILGLTDIVRRSLEKPEADIDKILVQLKHIEKSSKHLLGLLNDILDLSKIEAGKIELEKAVVNIPGLVQAVEAIIRPRCEESGVNFEINVDERADANIISDSLRIRQVLINLLGNAVKFTPEQGSVHLNVNILDKEATRMLVQFEVIDSGIGIAEEAISKLFTPFEQAESDISRKYGGTGLGLSISNSIINLLGGAIDVQSVLGEGSNFSFTVWYDLADPEEITEENNVSSESTSVSGFDISKKRILLADDVDLNRLIIVEMLKHTGVQIEEVADGSEAIEKFAASEENYYDLILMDALMPKVSGYEAATAIRNLERSDAVSIPIIAVTANAFKEDVERALSSGMNAHLAKPVDYDKLLEIVKEYINKKV